MIPRQSYGLPLWWKLTGSVMAAQRVQSSYGDMPTPDIFYPMRLIPPINPPPNRKDFIAANRIRGGSMVRTEKTSFSEP